MPFPNVKNKKLYLNKLYLIHTDLCGPMEVKSWSDKRYILTFIDDHSRMVFIYVLCAKSEVKSCMVDFLNMVNLQCGSKVKKVRSDNGTEYCNKDIKDLFSQGGIKHHLTAPYTPQQNDVAERYNRTIMEKVRSMLEDSQLDERMWAEAANTAVYLINRSPTKKILGKTSYEAWYGQKPNLGYLRVFGSIAYVHIPDEKRTKLQSTRKKFVFVGYCEESKAYRLFDETNHKVVVSRDVIFIESPHYQTNDNQVQKPL